jgi:hypothetical protein
MKTAKGRFFQSVATANRVRQETQGRANRAAVCWLGVQFKTTLRAIGTAELASIAISE